MADSRQEPLVQESIPLSMPDITDDDVHNVVETLRSGELTAGGCVERFEWRVARQVGRSRAVAVNAGTSGMLLSLIALGVKPGDEVIVPAFGSRAANSVELLGAKPIVLDCDPRTLNLRPDHVESCVTSATRAVVAADVFGNPVGMNELAALSTKLEIPLIEDAGEGLGGRHRGDPVGRFGRVAVLSFARQSAITTGEGGMIVTHEDRLADRCMALRNDGRSSLTRDHEKGMDDRPLPLEPGLNCRMTELSAALGDSQMSRLNAILEERQRVAEAYTRRLSAQPDLILPSIQSETVLSWSRFVVRLTDRYTDEDRDNIIDGMRRHDVGAAAPDLPLPLMPWFRQKYGTQPGDFPAAESVSQRSIMLPMFARLTDREVDLICQTLELMMTRQTFSRS